MNWNDILNDEVLASYNNTAITEVKAQISAGKTIYPPTIMDGDEITSTQIYRAMELTPLDKVRVVILGQDPYHEVGQANGLAFSVYDGVKMPPSLRNIFKELNDDIGTPLRTNTDLSDWAEQGVLLLNTALTVIDGQANSMAQIWEPYTDRLIELIDQNQHPVIFVLWGGNARKKKALIKNNKSLIIESAHPSPLSAYRGFFGSKPFSKINSKLVELNQEPIQW